MKKPATTWPRAVPTSVARVTMPSVPVLPDTAACICLM